jgi:hypothetical protein
MSQEATKREPVPGGITGPNCPGGYKYRNLVLQVGEVLNLKIKKNLSSHQRSCHII